MAKIFSTPNTPMYMSVSHNGILVSYKCYHVPGYGKRCKDKNSDKCMRCKYCKAEMSAIDATRLLYGRGEK